MIVDVGRRSAACQRVRGIFAGLSKSLGYTAAAVLATLLASFVVPSAGWAASVPVLTAVVTAKGANVTCLAGACGIFDTNHAAQGESTTLDASGTILTPDGSTITEYQWIIDNGSEMVTMLPTLGISLADGAHHVLLTVLDSAARTSQATLDLTVYGPSVAVITGGQPTVSDTDRQPGESVSLQSTGSAFGDCTAPVGTACTNLTYKWMVNGQAVGVNSPNPTLRLNDGANSITLIISDTGQSSLASAAVNITVGPPPPTAAIAGGNRTVTDSDGKAGESVGFDGRGSSAAGGGTITTYAWSLDGGETTAATGPQPTLALKDGSNTVTLRVTDSFGAIGTASVTVAVGTANAPMAAIAGGNRSVADTDGKPGESVTVDGSGSTAEAGAALSSYSWSVNGTAVATATGPTPKLSLKDGANTVSLVVTDNRGQQSTATSVTITVSTTQAVTPTIAGGNRSVADADGLPGERVAMAGTISGGAGEGGIPESAFAWVATAMVQGQSVTVDSAQGISKPTLRLRDGANTVTLTVTDPASESVTRSSVTIMVAGSNLEGAPAPLSSIPGLTANQKSVAQAIERSCTDLTAKYETGTTLGAGPTDLLQQCRALINDYSNAENVAGLQGALDSLSGQQISGMQRMGLDFSDSQFKSLSDRLTELRRGQRGVSASGVHVEGGAIEMPLADLASVLGKALGGGAGDSPGLSDLLSDRFGIFVTANLRMGDRQASDRESASDLRSHGVTVGLDYRFTDNLVAGGAFGYARAKSEFAAPEARLDSKNVTVMLYGSYYVGDGYLDFMASHGKLDYDSRRHILFASSVVTATNGEVDRTAIGATGGRQNAVSANSGYDWHWRGLSVGPLVSLSYVSVDIDGFQESGAEGLDLLFDSQHGESFTLKTGGHASYALNTRVGVLIPHVQAASVHEFASTARAITGRFQADVASGFSILTDDPDRNYFNWSAGMSAQFPFGIAGFVDYQAMAGLTRTTMHDISAGLRMATRW
ncbi:MAG: autotransporter domain-containing protein [Steroidobacteraceae bacterium]